MDISSQTIKRRNAVDISSQTVECCYVGFANQSEVRIVVWISSVNFLYDFVYVTIVKNKGSLFVDDIISRSVFHSKIGNCWCFFVFYSLGVILFYAFPCSTPMVISNISVPFAAMSNCSCPSYRYIIETTIGTLLTYWSSALAGYTIG